jgi:FOG: PKD repeat
LEIARQRTYLGKIFYEKNLNLTLPYPGVYYVNQTITNLFGITKVTNITNITAYPFKADFTAIPSNGSWPLTVSFIDQSVLEPILLAKEGLVNYTWTIKKEGDDSFFAEMDESNPFFTFRSKGIYNVSMNLTLGAINSGVVSKKINVTDSSGYPNLTLNASFSAVPQFGNPPLTVTFVDTSRKNEPVTYEWDFDDPIQNPLPVTTQNPRYTFLNSGDYTVSLKLTGVESGRTSECRQVISVQKLEADFSTRVDPADSRIIHFNSTTTGFPTLWTWRFGDGIVSRQENVTHRYSAAGSYNVTLTASNKIWSNTVIRQVILP